MATQGGVIFDLDGLLVDSEPLQARAFNVVLGQDGITLSQEDFEELVGFETIDNFRMLRQRYALTRTAKELLAAKDVAYHHLVVTELAPRQGIVSLVEGLADRGILLGIASSSPRTDVLLSLGAVGLAAHFPVVVTASDVPRSKPAPDLYLEACRRLELSPALSLAFEDSGTGCRAALAAGLRCIAIPHRYTREHDFTGALRVLDEASEVTVGDVVSLLS